MSKALVLVAVEDFSTARSYCLEFAKDLQKTYAISVKLYSTRPNILETPNVEVRFICTAMAADGLRADAIYGAYEHRKNLYPYAKPSCPKTPRVGLCEWVVTYEREIEAKAALNSMYGREALTPIPESLTQLVSSATRVATTAPFVTRYLGKFIYRKENENMSIKPYVMALANHQGPATIHAGGLSIPVKIMDIDSENHLFRTSETSLRCLVVNEDQINPIPSAGAQAMAEFVKRHLSETTRPSLRQVDPMKIDRVIFNEPATIVIWADGTKTIVKCQEGDVYSKETGLALCIAKKALGNKSNFNDVFRKYIPEEEKTPIAKELETKGITDLKFSDKKMVVYGEDAGTIAFTSSREDVEAIEKMIDDYVKEKANG